MFLKQSSRTVHCVTLAALGLLLIGANSQELTARREQIERMTPTEKAELIRKQERFNRLSPEKQNLLRELHKQLDAEPDSEALREVLWQYCAWLDTLLPYRRNDLKKLPVEQRVEDIKKRRYGDQDDQAIRKWGKAHFKKHKLTPRKFREDFAKFMRSQARSKPPHAWGKKPSRSWEKSWEKMADRLVKLFRLEEADLSSLLNQLSPDMQEKRKKETPKQQRRWLASQLAQLARPHIAPGTSKVVSDEELAKFFDSDKLTDQQRESLLRMPGDQMREQLLRWYRRMHAPRFPRGGPGPGRPDWNQRRFPKHGKPADASARGRDRRRSNKGDDSASPRARQNGPPQDWSDRRWNSRPKSKPTADSPAEKHND